MIFFLLDEMDCMLQYGSNMPCNMMFSALAATYLYFSNCEIAGVAGYIMQVLVD